MTFFGWLLSILGYVLTWTAGAATWAVRVSDHTHEAIGTPVRLGGASVEAAGYVDYDAGNPRVRVIAHQGNEVVVFPSVCGPTS